MTVTFGTQAKEIASSLDKMELPFPNASLDGKTITYAYVDGSAYQVTFRSGMAQREPLTGENKGKGNSVKSTYHSYKLANGMYRVRWTEEKAEDDLDFITLLIDLKGMRIYSASLANFGDKSSGEETVHFQPGVIYSVK